MLGSWTQPSSAGQKAPRVQKYQLLWAPCRAEGSAAIAWVRVVPERRRVKI